MHTVVLFSKDNSIDMNLLNALEVLFPESRIEIVNFEDKKPQYDFSYRHKCVDLPRSSDLSYWQI